jgi:hypothetical protein
VLVVAVQRVDLELHLHADLQLRRTNAFRHLPEHDNAFVGELDGRERVRLERFGGNVRCGRRVVVLGVPGRDATTA